MMWDRLFKAANVSKQLLVLHDFGAFCTTLPPIAAPNVKGKEYTTRRWQAI
ncbi:MAG: hypothetical protein ABJP79_09775 [Tateyamaria sp.]|uniref:hypothetical protein n=1 Tax=Tateyamaria sp. TaxID=1929288 RepID=UPI00329F3EE8